MKTRPSARLNLEALREAQAQGRFAEYPRKPKKLGSVTGYLLEASQDCFIVKSLNWDFFR